MEIVFGSSLQMLEDKGYLVLDGEEIDGNLIQSIPLELLELTVSNKKIFIIMIKILFYSVTTVFLLNCIVIVVPSPSLLVIIIFALYKLQICFTIANPKPVPPWSLLLALSTL